MRFFVLLLTVGGVGLLGPTAARAQVARVRFDILNVTDSTFTFSTTTSHWVSSGHRGIAVDPVHGDELIAQFRIVSVRGGVATAVITGQTARLTTSDVAVLRLPHPQFYQDPLFWIGTVAGGVVGFILHTHH